MHQVVDLSLIVSSQGHISCLLFVKFSTQTVYHLVLYIYYLFKSVRLTIKCLRQILQFLVFYHYLVFPLTFSLIQLSLVHSLRFLKLQVLLVNLVPQIFLPLYLSVHKLLFQPVRLLLCFLTFLLISLLQHIKFLIQIFMLNRKFIQTFLNLVFVSVQQSYIFFEPISLRFQLIDPILEDLLFRLNKLGFLSLLLYPPLQLYLEILLQQNHPLLAFNLHLSDNSLIHRNHFVKTILNSLLLSLQVVHLVPKCISFGFQFPITTGFLFNFSQEVGLSKKNVISQFAGGKGHVTVCSLPIFLRFQLAQYLLNFLLVTSTHQQLLHQYQKLLASYPIFLKNNNYQLYQQTLKIKIEYQDPELLTLRLQGVVIILFVEMNYEEDYVEFANQDLIHIHKVNTRGRKCQTRVSGIPDIFDYRKLLKFWRKNFQTNGRICKQGEQTRIKGQKYQSDEENKDADEVLVVMGDHREKIKAFLVYMGITDKENIRVHGAS